MSIPEPLVDLIWTKVRKHTPDQSESETERFYVSAGDVCAIHHHATSLSSGRLGVRKVGIVEFLANFSCVFGAGKLDPGQKAEEYYDLDMIPCMLQDCHAIVLDSEGWEWFKQELHGDSRPRPMPRAASSNQHELDGSRKRLLFAHPAGDANSQSLERSDSFASVSSSSKLSRLSTSTRQTEDLKESNDSLMTENRLLKELSAEKNRKLIDQQKLIKNLKVKLGRQGLNLDNLAANVKKHKLKDNKFDPTRVRSDKKKHQQLRRLDAGKVQSYLQHDEEEDCKDNDEQSGWLTPQGSVALAVRRNLGNASAEDTGLMILHDISKQSILRSECRAGAALIASARNFFREWQYEDDHMNDDETSFLFLQYKQDATNASKHRQKMQAMEINAAYLIAKQSELADVTDSDFSGIRRLADVVPVHDGYGTGVGTVALSRKLLLSLSAPTWETFLSRPALYDGDRQQFGKRQTNWFDWFLLTWT